MAAHVSPPGAYLPISLLHPKAYMAKSSYFSRRFGPLPVFIPVCSRGRATAGRGAGRCR
ncbi:hypothetical protein FRAHR75_60107 [Frankia sp. Hr75.2]|nr:hypothetical protein FRAHR75_60107 [Frankia sp. Hr75.2]